MEKPKLSALVKGYLCLAFPSTMLILIGSILVTSNPSRPLFRPSGEIKMANYLESHAKVNSLVLSAFETGNNLPAWAPVQVLQGHGPETINLENVIRGINNFFDSRTTEAVREKFLMEEAVKYLVWGPLEREQWLWTPEQADYLTQIYNQDGYVIYQFNR